MEKTLSVLLFFALGVYWGLGVGIYNIFAWPVLCVSTILSYIFFSDLIEIFATDEEVLSESQLKENSDHIFYIGKFKSLNETKDDKLSQFLSSENPQLASIILSALPEHRREAVFRNIESNQQDKIKDYWAEVKPASDQWIDYLDEAIGMQSHKIS